MSLGHVFTVPTIKDHQQNCKNSDSDFIKFVYECTVPRSDKSRLWGQKLTMAFLPHCFVEQKKVQCFVLLVLEDRVSLKISFKRVSS